MAYLIPKTDLNQVAEDLIDVIRKLNHSKILLSGCTGFIGKNLLEALFWLSDVYKLDIEILGVSRNPEEFYKNNPHFKSFKNLKIEKLDIKEIGTLNLGKIDFVIHAATDVSKINKPIQIFEDAYWGTKQILDLSEKNGVKAFLLLSSGAVYGSASHNNGYLEDQIGGISPQNLSSAYALGKQASEWLCESYKDKFDVKIARCFAFTGPYLPLDKHFAIGNFIYSVMNKIDIEIHGDGKPTRSYLYSSDMVTILLRLLLTNGAQGVWNIGGDEEISIYSLAKQVNFSLGGQSQIIMSEKQGIVGNRYFPNLEKVKKEFSWMPKVSLEKAIQNTARWNQDQG